VLGQLVTGFDPCLVDDSSLHDLILFFNHCGHFSFVDGVQEDSERLSRQMLQLGLPDGVLRDLLVSSAQEKRC
jgi:hypothetical protein